MPPPPPQVYCATVFHKAKKTPFLFGKSLKKMDKNGIIMRFLCCIPSGIYPFARMFEDMFLTHILQDSLQLPSGTS